MIREFHTFFRKFKGVAAQIQQNLAKAQEIALQPGFFEELFVERLFERDILLVRLWAQQVGDGDEHFHKGKRSCFQFQFALFHF